MTPRTRTTILTALLALALLVPASAQAAVERTVSVTAEATLKVPNDSASLGFSVSRERRSRGAALRAVAGGLRGVIAAVQAIPGVGPGDVTTGRISVRKSFRGDARSSTAPARASASPCTSPTRPANSSAPRSAPGRPGSAAPASSSATPKRPSPVPSPPPSTRRSCGRPRWRPGPAATLGPALTIDEGEGPELTPAVRDGGTQVGVGLRDLEPAGHRHRPDRGQAHQRALHHRPAADQARHLDGDRNGPRRLRPAVGRSPGRGSGDGDYAGKAASGLRPERLPCRETTAGAAAPIR